MLYKFLNVFRSYTRMNLVLSKKVITGNMWFQANYIIKITFQPCIKIKEKTSPTCCKALIINLRVWIWSLQGAILNCPERLPALLRLIIYRVGLYYFISCCPIHKIWFMQVYLSILCTFNLVNRGLPSTFLKALDRSRNSH